MNKTVLLIIAVIAISAAACTKKDYTCNCSVDFPDTAGISLDYDTTFTFEDKAEEIATTEAAAYEEGASVLIPSGVSSNIVDINCVLTEI